MLTERNVLLFLAACGLIVFVYNILFLPTWAFVDAGTHLDVVQRMLAGEPFRLVAGDLFPFWYHVVAGFFSLCRHVPFQAWNKFWALIVFLPSFSLVLSISKRLFREKYLLPLAFFLGNWWVLNYSSISYIEPFLGLQLLFFFWLFLREKDSEGNTFLNNGVMLAVAGSMALTKLTGLALAPFLIAFIILLYYKKSKNWQLVLMLFLGFLIALYCIAEVSWVNDSKAVFLFNSANDTIFSAGRFALNPFGWMPKFRELLFAVLNFPPNHCLNLLVFGPNLELVQGIFFYLFMPFSACCLFGLWKAFKSKKVEWIAIGFIALLGFGIVISQWLALSRYILPRYTVPVWGLLGLLFAKGYYSLDSGRVKKLVFVSFALFCVYSFAYTSNSTYRYWKVERAFQLGLEFVKETPGEARFAISYVPAGAIAGFEGKSIIHSKLWQAGDLNDFGNRLKEAKASHVFVGCYREMFNPKIFKELADYNKAELLYKDECSQVWKILDYNFAVASRELGAETFESLTKPELKGATGSPDAPRALDECH